MRTIAVDTAVMSPAFVIVLAAALQTAAAPLSAAPAPQPDASVCVACHGAHGEGAAYGVPRLAGQNAQYLSHQLAAFRAGTRTSATMQPIARNLSDAQVAQLADYFSKRSAPLAPAPGPASPALVAAGKKLAESGAGEGAACFSCHAARGQGNGEHFPAIAGQPAAYTVQRIHDFQARAKAKAPQPGTMTAVAATMSESQVAEAAAYLAQLAH
jgi:cytochrome c553